MSEILEIKWKLIGNINNQEADIEKIYNPYSLCIEFNKKIKKVADITSTSVYPTTILKSPLKIKQYGGEQEGKIKIKKKDLERLLSNNEVSNIYIENLQNIEKTQTIERISVIPDCLESNCKYIKLLPNYKKLYLLLDLNKTCNMKKNRRYPNCVKSIISINSELLDKDFI